MRNSNKEEITKKRSYYVVKANEIIQKAKYELNISELKTMAYIFSKIKPTDKEMQWYTFSFKEYWQICGLDYKSGGNYQILKTNIKGLRDKSFILMNEDGTETTVGWLEKAKFNVGSGTVSVRLDEDLQKYVLGLFEKNYTQYELLSTLPMKSSYSFRIYELLKSYAYKREHTFDIDDLKKQLAATHYVNFKDFRRFVLEVATKEINWYTDIEVNWQPITKGRKVIQVHFEIKQRDLWGKFVTGSRATAEIEGQIAMDDEYYQ